MSSTVFFSILIPTKNRSHLIREAIESILQQSFKDFEIIIIDNDDSNDTQAQINQLTDQRIHYYRTGGLSMVENWEFGRKKTNGQFLTVLEDKQVYYPWALLWLHQTITNHNIDIITWNWDIKKNRRPPPPEESCHFVPSSEILDQYTKAQHPWKRLPRIINSCVSQKIIQAVCNNAPNQAFFTYFSPDLCAAFMQLAMVDTIFATNCRLGFLNSRQSNAKHLAKNKSKGLDYYAGNTAIDINDAVALVPIKKTYMPHNTIYNDYLTIRNLFPDRLKRYKMTPLAYTKNCIRDLLFIFKNNGKLKQELWQVIAYMFKNLSLFDQIKALQWAYHLWQQEKYL